jgi:hypothetical protein
MFIIVLFQHSLCMCIDYESSAHTARGGNSFHDGQHKLSGRILLAAVMVGDKGLLDFERSSQVSASMATVTSHVRMRFHFTASICR